MSVFGGGGHKKAAGGEIKGEISDVFDKILKEVGKYL